MAAAVADARAAEETAAEVDAMVAVAAVAATKERKTGLGAWERALRQMIQMV